MQRERPRLRDQSLNRLIPNMLTVIALCAGLTGIRYGMLGKWEAAVIAILVAGILDGLDGRIARLLNGASKFGAELDSLSDFVSFGVAPALLTYYWTLNSLRGVGWTLALVFSVCCALRLARFNTRIDNTDLPAWTGKFFTGVPAPAGAGLALMPMVVNFQFGAGIGDQPVVVAAVMLVTSLLMVSRVPTYSFKRVRVPHRLVVPTLLVVGLLAACLVSLPWVTLLLVGAGYIASIPLSILAYGKLSRVRPTLATDADASRNTPVT
jgi:CDP-diacylglycerol---serine O-phosphatidyltransferase